MAYSKTWIYNDQKFIFKLTRYAQLEIEKIQKRQQMKVFENEETIKSLGELDALQKGMEKIEKITEEDKKIQENLKFISKNASTLAKVRNLDTSDPLDLYKLGYILLKNYSKNPVITEDEYKLMTIEMEDEMGLEETVNFFVEMRDKVFTEMEQINKAINKPRMTVPKEVMN